MHRCINNASIEGPYRFTNETFAHLGAYRANDFSLPLFLHMISVANEVTGVEKAFNKLGGGYLPDSNSILISWCCSTDR